MKMKHFICALFTSFLTIECSCLYGGTPVSKLTDTILAKELDEVRNAFLAGDISRVMSNIAPEWQLSFTVESYGERYSYLRNKDEYRERIESSFTNGRYVSITLTNYIVQLSSDGQYGSLSYDFRQTYAQNDADGTIVLYGVQTNNYKLIAGIPTVVKTTGIARKENLPAPPPSILATTNIVKYRNELPAAFEEATREQIIQALPSDAYLFVDAETEIPSSWPSEVRMLIDDDSGVGAGEQPSRTLLWWMTLDGDEWVLFYSFGLDLYRKNMGIDPAIIYEKRTVNGRIVVIPVMLLAVTDANVTTIWKTSGCEIVRNNAFARHARLPIHPDDILRQYKP